MSKLEEMEANVLTHCNSRWQKIAMIIVKTSQHLEDGEHDPWDACHAAVISLIEKGSLSVRGDPGRPRFSEVRVA